VFFIIFTLNACSCIIYIYSEVKDGEFLKILMKPVDMISYNSTAGDLQPIKYRLSDENGISKIIKIDKIIQINEEKLAGNRMIIFRVQSIINGLARIYELKYEPSACKWYIYKM